MLIVPYTMFERRHKIAVHGETKCTLYDCEYACGYEKPNYPVPALRYQQVNADWYVTGKGWIKAYRNAHSLDCDW